MKLGGGGEPCTLCEKTVYPAERQKNPIGLYHVKCFSCTRCKRQLQQSTYVEDSATGRLYCRPHYTQLAKEAGLEKLAAGGVDVSAGILVQKRVKAEVEVDVDRLVVGSSVWVECGSNKAAGQLAGGRTDEPFVRSQVLTMGEEAVGVQDTSGAQANMPPHLVMLAEPASMSGKINNLQLLHLNEPNLLDNVRARFQDGQIYTYTGQLELLAINPYEDIASLYSDATMATHRDATDGSEVAPHTFAVAERVWRAVLEANGGKEGKVGTTDYALLTMHY
jgi:myosin-5